VIKEWPVTEQPREKLLEQGAARLSDAELLAIFLGRGVQGQSAVDVGRKMLNQFTNLRGVLDANLKQCCEVKGVGTVAYCLFQAAQELSRRYMQQTLNRHTVFANPTVTRDYLSMQLRHKTREVFAVLFLSNQHALISYEEMFFGTINMASVYPREIVKRALELGAAAVILAHNHPSGIAEPSNADIHITQQIKKALLLIDIAVLDHCVVGDAEVVSLAERGCL
jgi:DNA repair protein RadC